MNAVKYRLRIRELLASSCYLFFRYYYIGLANKSQVLVLYSCKYISFITKQKGAGLPVGNLAKPTPFKEKTNCFALKAYLFQLLYICQIL